MLLGRDLLGIGQVGPAVEGLQEWVQQREGSSREVWLISVVMLVWELMGCSRLGVQSVQPVVMVRELVLEQR